MEYMKVKLFKQKDEVESNPGFESEKSRISGNCFFVIIFL